MATIIHPDASTSETSIPDDVEEALAHLQEIVGGELEVVQIGDRMLVVNEEGKALRLAPNDAAMRIAAEWSNLQQEGVLGVAVLLAAEEAETF